MTGTVCIHQPNYLPWIGFFSKVSLCDSLIVYDTAQYEKNSVINRNRIRTHQGWMYLTVPVPRPHLHTPIIEVPLPGTEDWKKHHWKSILTYYARAPYFRYYSGFFQDLFCHSRLTALVELNLRIIEYLLDCFEINPRVVRTSQVNVDPLLRKTDLMVAYLKAAGATSYLSGPSGKDYLEADKFAQSRIELRFHAFEHPEYRQVFPGFEPNMSAIDLLFNEGPRSGEIIRQSGAVADGSPPQVPGLEQKARADSSALDS